MNAALGGTVGANIIKLNRAVVAEFAIAAFFIPFCRGGRKNADRRGRNPRTEKHSGERITMKREFLQNLKVGDQALPKEIIDEIMAENGRDIEAAKKPFADYDTIKNQLSEAQKAIKGFQDQGADIEEVRKSAKDWEDKYNAAIADHNQKMADMAFDHSLEAAITGAKGKNAKAIRALLDVDTLKSSKNQEADIKAALEDLKKDSGYLFDDGKAPPPYSGGTGTQNPQPSEEPVSLAGALRAKYNMT